MKKSTQRTQKNSKQRNTESSMLLPLLCELCIKISKFGIAAFLLIIVGSSFVSAQTKKIDSLYAVLKTEKEDTNKVNTITSLDWELGKRGMFSRADSLCQAALQLAEKIGYKKGVAIALTHSGVIYLQQGNYPEAIKQLEQSLEIARSIHLKQTIASDYGNLGLVYNYQSNYPEALKYDTLCLNIDKELNNKVGMGLAYGNTGTVYYIMGNYPEALNNLLQGLKINEELGDKKGMALAYGNIANVYDVQGNHAEALNNQIKALKIGLELGLKEVSSEYGNIGIIYQEQGDNKKALENYLKALETAKRFEDNVDMSMAYGNIGTIYAVQANYTEALKNLFESIRLAHEDNYLPGLGDDYVTVGDIYTGLKQFAMAKKYLDSALSLSKSIGNRDGLRAAYVSRVRLDSAIGDFKGAYTDYKTAILYRDSLKNEENTKKMVSEQMQYEFDKKQAKEKAAQDKKDAIAAQENKKQRIIRNAFIAGFALVLTLAFFIFRGYRQKQKTNEIITRQKQEVEKQKEIVEEKQKEIVDSIHYAQRIQKALLASDALLKQNLPEHFVLFKPKDIVSGDFYWATSNNGRFYLAVCDSTGHGVPGAFMSLLNTSFLNEAINEKNISSPNEVFDHARKRLIEHISQDGQQDGMDGVLASLYPSEGGTIMQYAAAYNSPIVVRNKEIVELETDKMPVGASPKEKEPFRLRSTSLQKGDCLYLFTDGFADQFGGPKGKKFMYKQLQQLIIDNAQLTMEQQKSMLEKVFDNWKGSLEQVDDVCVIGIRI